MTRVAGRQKRQRGSIDELPSGALRVRVYAGVDPVTRRRHDLIEIIPAGPGAERRAEQARVRLLAEVQERRNPRTSATVDQLLDQYLTLHNGGKTTLSTYRMYAEKHIRPFLGHVKVGALEADVVDSLYAELRRCREHCNGRRFIEHRTTGEHDCDQRCSPHHCKPLADATIRQIHFLLSGAYNRAIKWRWVSRNPLSQAEPPASPSPDPDPPRAAEAAQLLREAWKDPDWGSLIWLAMTTGARRGELCALRWKHVDLVNGVLTLRRSIAQNGAETEEKDTKTHQRRHVTLDPETVSVLNDHWNRSEARSVELGVALNQEAFVFSNAPDSSTHLIPSSVTQRYRRMAERAGYGLSPAGLATAVAPRRCGCTRHGSLRPISVRQPAWPPDFRADRHPNLTGYNGCSPTPAHRTSGSRSTYAARSSTASMPTVSRYLPPNNSRRPTT
jgi:integrase